MMKVFVCRNWLRNVFSASFTLAAWLTLACLLTPDFHLKAEQATVLAKIENIGITQKDLNDRLNKLPKNQKVVYATAEGQQVLLKEMVRLELFYREALAMELDQNPEYRAKIERIAKGMLASAFVNQTIVTAVNASDQEAETYYRQHKSEYVEPEKIKAHSVFFLINDDQSLGTAQDKANKMLKRVENGESFAELSKQLSENPIPVPAKHEYFARGRLDPAIEEQVFNLKIGEISPILTVSDGLIVFQLEDRTPARELDFAEVKDGIIKLLEEEKREEFFFETERRLMEKYQASYN